MSASGVREMLPAERRARIVAALRAQPAVRVAVLSEDLGVSGITIRRDLRLLEQEGILARTHGGAVRRRQLVDEPVYEENAVTHAAEKDRIARAAAAMIEPHDTVFLGSGTTVVHLLHHIDPDLEARVVTHNLAAATEARGLRLELVFLGGLYRPQLDAVEGSWPLDMIQHFNADKAFVGADCLDPRAGLTTPSIAVAAIELAMIRRTRGEVVVLADSSKIGLVGRGGHLPSRPDRRGPGRRRSRRRGLRAHPAGRTALRGGLGPCARPTRDGQIDDDSGASHERRNDTSGRRGRRRGRLGPARRGPGQGLRRRGAARRPGRRAEGNPAAHHRRACLSSPLPRVRLDPGQAQPRVHRHRLRRVRQAVQADPRPLHRARLRRGPRDQRLPRRGRQADLQQPHEPHPRRRLHGQARLLPPHPLEEPARSRQPHHPPRRARPREDADRQDQREGHHRHDHAAARARGRRRTTTTTSTRRGSPSCAPASGASGARPR